MYLTQNNTFTKDPGKAKIFRSMPDPESIHHSLAIFKYDDYYIVGKPVSSLTRNPLDPDRQFNSKKFNLRCESLGVPESEVKDLILATPIKDQNYDRSVSWLISTFINGNLQLEDIGPDSSVTEYLTAFFIHKNKLEQKDLNQYSYPSEVFASVKPYIRIKKRTNIDPTKIPGAKFIAQDEFGSIWRPETAEASCALGKDTEWCTAKYRPDDKRNAYKDYKKSGELYIYFDYETGKRFQYHTEGELSNENNKREYNENFVYLLSDFDLIESLNLSHTQIKELPADLKVGGSLNLYNTPIKELPANLKVGGYLDLSYSQIKELPANLKVGGSLNLSRTQIKELPANLKVGGYLDLRNTQIKELPANLKVGGFLNLSGTQIKELPANLKVGGFLDLSYSQIKELPADLKVGGYLDLRNTQIKELPANLKVGEHLDLRNTQIKELPADLKVGGFLNLRGTQIKELPADLKVGGFLNLSGTQIKELPADLKVGGYLDLSYSQIKELPADLKVGGGLYLYDTQIKKIPKSVVVEGGIYR